MSIKHIDKDKESILLEFFENVKFFAKDKLKMM